MAVHLGVGVQHAVWSLGLARGLGPAGCTVLAVLGGVAANAGAARTETASSAAEIVLNMVVSSFKGDLEVAGRMVGLFDHGATVEVAR